MCVYTVRVSAHVVRYRPLLCSHGEIFGDSLLYPLTRVIGNEETTRMSRSDSDIILYFAKSREIRFVINRAHASRFVCSRPFRLLSTGKIYDLRLSSKRINLTYPPIKYGKMRV